MAVSSVLPEAATAAVSNTLSFAGLNRLREAARAHDPAAIMAVAKQFESVLLQELLSSMSKTSFGPDLLGETAGPMFQSLFNQQIAQNIGEGKGIGLASTLAKEIASRYGLHWGPVESGEGLGTSASAAFAAPARNLGLSSPVPETAATADAQDFAQPPANLLQRAKAFVQSILPAVQSAARQLGVSPVAILAQAAQETGWGSHAVGHNLFGIKAGGDWKGSSANSLTSEFVQGMREVEQASFRAYDSVKASVENYTNLLLHSPRYREALGQGQNIAAFASALQAGGYATDPHYASKIVAIAQSPLMQQVLAQTTLAVNP